MRAPKTMILRSQSRCLNSDRSSKGLTSTVKLNPGNRAAKSRCLILAGLGKEGDRLAIVATGAYNPDPSIRLAAAAAVAHIQPDCGDVASLVTGLITPT